MSPGARLVGYGLAGVACFAVAARLVGPVTDIAQLAGPTAITIVVVASLGWLLARRESAGMSSLRDATRALAAGDLNARPPLAGPAEVADVAAAVHRLAEQLRSRGAAQEAADALLAALLESLNESVVVLDSNERVIRLNTAARELFGVQHAVPFPAEQLPRARGLHHTLRSALQGQDVEPVEVEIRGRNVSLTGRPLSGGGAVIAALDLTPLRKLETVRRDFVANVSHELRTPLTVVRGFAETLAAEEVAPETRREFSAMISANTERMQRIVDDLLDLSRIESGGWVPEPAALELRPVAEEALAQAGPHAREKGLSLAVEIAPGADSVHADRVAVIQTLSNLIENAVRHTAAGSVTVFAEPADGGVWLGVRDTGQGIPREHLPRIFERFCRADPGRSRQSGGTGLGLAIVKHLVEAHGGTVVAESDVGRGTTVRAFFPTVGAG